MLYFGCNNKKVNISNGWTGHGCLIGGTKEGMSGLGGDKCAYACKYK